MGLGSEIRKKTYSGSWIPDPGPGVKKALDPGSWIRIRNTACLPCRREEEFLEKHKHVSLLEQHKELQERNRIIVATSLTVKLRY
jgi:hypothetical protein